MSRKSSSNAASKNSSALTTGSSSTTAQRSSVLKSSFSPSQFQLRLFASVIQSFDSQQLRIHETSTGRLRCQHETRPGSRITSLDWGYYGRDQKQQKKRKRQDNAEGAVVAYGTSTSEICMFSPAEGKVVGTLSGEHERAITDFKFSPATDYKEGWSIGEDAKLIQWDLIQNKAIRTISTTDGIHVLATPSPNPFQVLCASDTPFAYDIAEDGDFQQSRYDSFKNPVHSLFRSGITADTQEEFFLAADTDRYVNVFNLSSKRLVRTLIAGSGVVASDFYDPAEEVRPILREQLLSVVTEAGLVELFWRPFAQPKQVNGDLKSSKKNLTRKSGASIRLVSSDSKTKSVPVFAASIQGPEVVVASADGGVDFSFQKIRWQDEGNGELLFDGPKDFVKVKAASTLNTATLNGVKDTGNSHLDESKTVVVNGGSQPVTIDISDSEDDEDDEEEEEDNEEDEEEDEPAAKEGEEDDDEAEEESDEEMAEADEPNANEQANGDEDEEMAEPEEPTFGELLASKHPHEISIASALQNDPSATALTATKGLPVIPSGMSLGTVLTQSLRTNDHNLLERCLHTLDINIVKNTIQRLDSNLAGVLLGKLAERLASRPGRYGNLITWVQWTCIAHGGAIAAQPDVTAKVRTLYQVLGQRSKTLDNLLLLKGKLDMLDAQLNYRKQLAAQRPARRDGQDEPGMIYIEGEDNWDSDEDEDLDEDIARPIKRSRKAGRSLEGLVAGEDDDDEEDEDDEDDAMALENGVGDSDDEEEDEEDEDEDGVGINGTGLVDVEAEVSSADESDEDHGLDGPADEDESEVSSEDDNEDQDEEDEEDSDLDSFINDGEIDIDDEEDDVHVEGDSEPEPEPAPVPTSTKVGKSKKARQI
ncbi:hypothetical protein PV11_05865 [Exophiala sideris]|uniref:Small-subunit processome Utp12 domain-containing protein n=1 Tax=Exophiala sideris TaxID=1016849 RepID=A0A0D1X7Q5_9EURO|nr:hypothetical protein PV11_05865 [Exophiala sideris]